MSDRTWQEMPGWLVYDVRAEHALAAKAGEAAPGERAVTAITDRLLQDDPEFARLVISRYVRSLLRAPKPRKRKKDADRDRLMADCVRLDAEGLALRAIGERKGIGKSTVARLLAEWQARLPEMPPHIIALSRPSVPEATPAGTPRRDSDPNVIQLRRPA